MQMSELSTQTSSWTEWCFRFTSPRLPENPTFAQRELTRRGRLASITVLFFSLFMLFPFFQGFIQGNPKQWIPVLISIIINIVALVTLNRRGKLAAAGWLVVFMIDAGFFMAVFTQPGGLSYQNLRSMDVIAEAVLVIVAFFPPRSVFIIAAVNTLGIILWTCFGPHSQDITQALQTNAYSLFYPPVSLEIFLAILVYLWANSALKAISDLDVTEKMVELEKRENERQSQELVLKNQLEEGIQLMLQTHVRAANGDFSARAPLTKENILWQLAYSLNNLLARLERFTAESRRHAITQEAIHSVAEQVRLTKARNQPLVLNRTGTALDELLIELNSLRRGSVEANTPPNASPNIPPVPPSRVIPMPDGYLQEKQEKQKKSVDYPR